MTHLCLAGEAIARTHYAVAVRLKETMKTNHVQVEYHASGLLRMCSESGRFRSFLRMTEG